jgi:hypothetical protein
MKWHFVFIIVAIALAWAALWFGYAGLFWVRMLGGLIGFFGFLFVFMLTDEVGDLTRMFGVDLIVIAVGLFVIWV